jgi:MFS transporter, MHS family, shikimate and dehydroshikimate transport protein
MDEDAAAALTTSGSMDADDARDAGSTRLRRIAPAAIAGTALEAYDLYLYSTAAALIFAPLFFAGVDPSAANVLSLGAFGVAFIARPFGAIIFGRLGDRRGRTRTLAMTLVLMGAATTAIGLTPDFSQVGVVAPIALTVLRFLQGFAYGGEFTGGVLLLLEHAPARRRGVFAGLNAAAPAIGFVLSSGAFLVMRTWLGEAAFEAWGWRVPFLLSTVLVGIGFVLRRGIPESPAFLRTRASAASARAVWSRRRHVESVVLTAGANVGHFVFVYLVTTFSLSYGSETLGIEQSELLGALTIAFPTTLLSIPAAAALSDRISRRPVIVAGFIAMALWVWPFFLLLGDGRFAALLVAYVVGMTAFALAFGPLASFTTEAFPPHVRYTGAALSYQIAGVVGAGLGPATAAWLVLTTGGWSGAAIYVTVAATVSLICVMASRGRVTRKG